jgi:phosphotransferase system enzyme I (PtsI)
MTEVVEPPQSTGAAGEPIVLHGVGASPGIAIGKSYRYEKAAYHADERMIADEDIQNELSRLESAIRLSERDLHKIAAVARGQLGTESANLFEAQALMLHDPAFNEAIRKHITNDRWAADYAAQTVMERHREQLQMSENPYLRERAHDMADVQHRLIRHLQRGQILSRIDEKRVVIAESLTAADLILFSRRNLLGCALDHGAKTAHVSIMSRALGIPAIVGLQGATERIEDGATVIVDALAGMVIANPDKDQLKSYRDKQARYQRMLEEQKASAALPAATLDGRHVQLMANLELEEEVTHLEWFGAKSVGLFRTELLFMSDAGIPDEETQLACYTRIVDQIRPEITTFRLLDVGGDKIQLVGPSERNPDLGWRGIRVLLERDDLLQPQLRALLRVSAKGPIRILIPMVSEIHELRRFREIMAATIENLEREGHEIGKNIPVGVMIEVPSAALQARHFAEESDFMSIGTNDLTQYVLAVDRTNDLVAQKFNERHPAVLRLISKTIAAGKEAGTPVSVCGELAAQVPAIPILIGLGLEEFSASPIYLPEMKRVIRGVTIDECVSLAESCVEQPDGAGVERQLKRWFSRHSELRSRFRSNSD